MKFFDYAITLLFFILTSLLLIVGEAGRILLSWISNIINFFTGNKPFSPPKNEHI